jgi:hypothetical protein
MNADQTWGIKIGFSIMAVSHEEGQSLLEFVLMLPLLVGLSIIMVRVNQAIQVSIVNQQYARADALFLSFNSPIYPVLAKQTRLIQFGTNQLILGVGDNVAGDGDANYRPKATVQLIARSKKVQASDAPGEEPPTRSLVRVRGTVTLCTNTFTVKGASGQASPVLPVDSTKTPVVATGRSALGEQTTFDLCGSPIKYLSSGGAR